MAILETRLSVCSLSVCHHCGSFLLLYYVHMVWTAPPQRAMCSSRRTPRVRAGKGRVHPRGLTEHAAGPGSGLLPAVLLFTLFAACGRAYLRSRDFRTGTRGRSASYTYRTTRARGGVVCGPMFVFIFVFTSGDSRNTRLAGPRGRGSPRRGRTRGHVGLYLPAASELVPRILYSARV